MSRHRHADNQTGGKPHQECVYVRARLLEFLDGELATGAYQKVQRHLDGRPDCRREWDQYRQAEHALQTAHRNIPAPGDLRAGFYARLAATAPVRRPSLAVMLRRAALPTIAVPAIAAVLLVAHFSQSGHTVGPVYAPPVSKTEPASPIDPYHPTVAQDSVPTRKLPHQTKALSSDDVGTPPRVAGSVLGLGAKFQDRPHIARARVKDTKPTMFAMLDRSMTTQNHRSSDIAALGFGSGVRLHTDERFARLESRAPEIVRSFRAYHYLPQVSLPPVQPTSLAATYSEATVNKEAMMGLSLDSLKVDVMAAKSAIAHFGRVNLTRAELMNEEVQVHIVNDRNEEVDSVHVASGTMGQSDPKVVHVEADAAVESAGQQPETP